MKKFIQSLSPQAEFWLVVVVAFGWLIVSSILRGLGVSHQQALTDRAIVGLFVYEIGIGGVLLASLKARHWTLQKIGFRPGLNDTALGLALLVGTNILWAIIFYITWAVSPATVKHMQATSEALFGAAIFWPVVIAASLLNAAFEEIFVAGFVVTALKAERGSWFAVNVSVLIRLLYHLYQGQMGVLGALPIGLVYSWFYARTGRLWPVFVAHALQDMAGLAMHH